MKTLNLILSHFPTVLLGVAAVEQAMPGAPGADKKAVLLAGVSAAAAAAKVDPSEHVQAAGILADAIVSAFNATIWAKPKTQAAAAK